MSRGSKWHKDTQRTMMQEYEDKGYIVKKERKIGFDSKVTRETQFKQVDIVAEKDKEIILIEIEDRIYHTKRYGAREYGVGYVEFGGILFLSYLFARLNPDKNVQLLLVFRDNIISFRKKNIESMISEFQKNCKKLTIGIQYRDEKGCKIWKWGGKNDR